MYQSHIETNQTSGFPFRPRIGRQEMKMGKGWLLDDITAALTGHSFDGVRATYGTDVLDVDAWFGKLAESGAREEDGDVDFYGVYAAYKAVESLNASLYWMHIRDAQSLNGTNFTTPAEWVEDALNLDDYDPANLHTVGPHFDGEDNRDLSFVDWVNPLYRSNASVSFNRLFPGKPYSSILEIGQDMPNFWQVRTGATVHPFEAVTVGLQVAYYGVNEPFDAPWSVTVGRLKIPIVPALSFLTERSSEEIGTTTHLFANCQYSPELFFKVGWKDLFTGQGLEDGNFIHRRGLEFSGGTDDDDADHLHLETGLKIWTSTISKKGS